MKRILVACLTVLSAIASLHAQEAKILELSGRTMGTRYMVKIFEPPQSDQHTSEQTNFAVDIHLEIDALLRRVNDQMSTYLRSSEISRFNQSDSTDWFDVSVETATVVEFAQQVAAKTDGAFDVTVGPLVNAWNFGPDPRTRKIPNPTLLDQLKQSVGYEMLSVRINPPALRKSNPDVKVDLSAIAKGFGVDQVVSLLNKSGAKDVFVEIGGEVRTSGSKAGESWKVGIQLPDADQDDVMIAHAMSTGAGNDNSMATSGDYRNFFEVDGIRYSHTIDPRTAKPVHHQLASVSVVSASCMQADAWATAINVLGPDDGLDVSRREGLDVLLIIRQAEGFELAATGTLVKYTSKSESADMMVIASDLSDGVDGTSPLVLMAISTVAFALVLLAMSVGVMFGRRAISGSCGGLANSGNEDGSVSCSLCSNPDDACKELRRRVQKETQT